MNRRGFFGLFTAGTAVAINPALAELLVPKRTIFLPPAGGWLGGNRLLTVDALVKDLLATFEQAMHESNQLAEQVNREYDESFYRGDQWSADDRYSVVLSNPPAYAFNRIKGLA